MVDCQPLGYSASHRVAEDMGALGIRVENADEIAPALARALAARRPAVIDIATDIEALAPTAVT